MNESFYLFARLVSFAILLQSIEYFLMNRSLSLNGIWRWDEIKEEYDYLPIFLRNILNYLNQEKRLLNLISFRIFLAGFCIFYPFSSTPYGIMFFITYIINMRFRGSFNGGSDYLTLIALLCLFLGSLTPILMKAALYYIALQVISSYFLAGLFKIKLSKWRNGKALKGFLFSPSYRPPQWLLKLMTNPLHVLIGSWGILIFECTFPIMLINLNLAKIYISIGLIFHLINYLTFGLNRFFWIWTSCYPALYFLATQLQKI